MNVARLGENPFTNIMVALSGYRRRTQRAITQRDWRTTIIVAALLLEIQIGCAQFSCFLRLLIRLIHRVIDVDLESVRDYSAQRELVCDHGIF